jgi:hypothetical protein
MRRSLLGSLLLFALAGVFVWPLPTAQVTDAREVGECTLHASPLT